MSSEATDRFLAEQIRANTLSAGHPVGLRRTDMGKGIGKVVRFVTALALVGAASGVAGYLVGLTW